MTVQVVMKKKKFDRAKNAKHKFTMTSGGDFATVERNHFFTICLTLRGQFYKGQKPGAKLFCTLSLTFEKLVRLKAGLRA